MSEENLNFRQNEALNASFFQILRELELNNDHLPRVGNAVSIEQEFFRLSQIPSLAFPTSQIGSYSHDKTENLHKIGVNFFGLLGPNGAMPHHFTEYIMNRTQSYCDNTIEAFLNIFHHRLLTLFYKAWALNQQVVSYDRIYDDYIGKMFGNIAGFNLEAFEQSTAYSMLYWSSLLVNESRSAEGLEKILEGYFKVKVRVEEFIFHKEEIDEKYQSKLGDRESSMLGESTILGVMFFSVDKKIKIIFGPMSLEYYKKMLPNKDFFKELSVIIDSYFDKPVLWDAQMILKEEEVPCACLGSSGALGETAWMNKDTATGNVSDLTVKSYFLDEINSSRIK